MAHYRIKAGGCTKGRFKKKMIGMGSGKNLAKGRDKKPKRGKS